MALTKRTHRDDLAWADWLPTRSLFEWPSWLVESGFKVEEFLEDGCMVVRAELPGLDPDKDVEVSIAHHTLTIRAERKREEKSEDTSGYRSEFEYGSFVRSLRLPPTAVEDKVSATYGDGILEVRVPVEATNHEARTVPVTRAA